MGNPVFKFTLTHSASGTSRIISEPIGWKECVLKLERHVDFHSIIEYFEGPSGGFMFYGKDGTIDGGCEYIKHIEKTYGFNTKLQISVDLSFNDGVSYNAVFSGILSLGHLKEFPDNKISVPILPDTIWTKFISRMNTPVNLSSSTDLDGNSISAVPTVTINLPSQAVRHKFKRTINYNPDNTGLFTSDTGSAGTTHYLIFDNSRHDLDEIGERFEYGTQVSATNPTTAEKYLFKLKYEGDYIFDISIRYSLVFGASTNVTVQWYLAYSTTTGGLTTEAIGSGTGGTAVTTHKTGAPSQDLNITLYDLPAGTQIFIYGVVTTSVSTTVNFFPDFDNDPGAGYDPQYTELDITGDTLYPNSTAEGYLAHDVMAGIIHRITGSNCFYSELFGGVNTTMRTYASNGAYMKFCLLKGLHIRGYIVSEKPFFISFKDAWNGLNPIFNLGLGDETINGQYVIRMEEKELWYGERRRCN